MKNLNLVLVLTLLACYSGFGSRSEYSSPPSNYSNCHSVKKEAQVKDKHESNTPLTYYVSEGTMIHGAFRCCFESLINAPQKDGLTLKDFIRLDPSFIGESNLETNRYLNSGLNVSIREHDPPDLYVSNSSLLL